ncbi:MAG: hypothetical protein ACMUIP_07785 [bacterium]
MPIDRIEHCIARTILMGLPPYIYIVQPEPSAHQKDLNNVNLVAISEANFDEDLRMAIMKITPQRHNQPQNVLNRYEMRRLREVKKNNNYYGDYSKSVFTEMVSDIRESAFDELSNIYKKKNINYTLSYIRLIRQIWELITGQVLHHCVCSHQIASKKFNIMRPKLSDTDISLPKLLKEKIAQGEPLILTTRQEDVLLMELRENVMNFTLSYNDIKNFCYPIPNPFFQMLCGICKEITSMIDWCRILDSEEEKQADQKFLHYLQKNSVLSGKGDYHDFSMKWLLFNNRPAIRLQYSIGNTPFLQQVSREPVFIFWDLKKYPINIIIQHYLDETSNFMQFISFNNIQFQAECSHPSILKHAFVGGTSTSRHSFEGNICMENTASRILSLSNKDTFDPAICLLEQMRAAGRILRFGVRERDKGIGQLNSYKKELETNYQAVIKGWPQASAFAREHNAEIVQYNR